VVDTPVRLNDLTWRSIFARSARGGIAPKSAAGHASDPPVYFSRVPNTERNSEYGIRASARARVPGGGVSFMEFGILFTSHPNHATEPYPHRAVHARVTPEIEAADALGYDIAWVAEHHFSNQYGIMPDVFTYLGQRPCCTARRQP
jgi:hypothetical protein